MWRLAVIALVACSSGSSEPEPDRAPERAPAPAPMDAPAADGAVAIVHLPPPAPPFDLSEALAIIAARAAQDDPKMKLSATQADEVEAALRSELARSAPLGRLLPVMPHSTIELARAVHERGVEPAEADRIAAYLLHLVEVLDFEKLRRFDINHSHVTGREWHEIDYTGEGMTWQGQKEYWSPKGVISFRRAEYVHAYMIGAYRLPHFARVYAPRGSIDDVVAPRAEVP